MSGFEKALEAVHQAEESVYHAQASTEIGDRQKSVLHLQIAKEKVHQAQKEVEGDVDAQHRLHQAVEHLRHLEEAQQALED
ncbi:hypothetical protein JOC85_002084 [Bacillus mesophilus]|uniref:DUF2524 family protein n=1 Tax=Bacillus mesophilus TaxID=1808955 RepID=A0A6M0Q7W4_9BACI|nr:hypothetical protein [Bacillus mesophilus]MBM7661312.1 hypothetical protein [Bacillus mesophilus]NEY71168.1 hypothetical protein [Bacillus mesophilus]